MKKSKSPTMRDVLPEALFHFPSGMSEEEFAARTDPLRGFKELLAGPGHLAPAPLTPPPVPGDGGGDGQDMPFPVAAGPAGTDFQNLERMLDTAYGPASSQDKPNPVSTMAAAVKFAAVEAAQAGTPEAADRLSNLMLDEQLRGTAAILYWVRAELTARALANLQTRTGAESLLPLVEALIKLQGEERSIIATRERFSRPGPLNINVHARGPQQVNIGVPPPQRRPPPEAGEEPA